MSSYPPPPTDDSYAPIYPTTPTAHLQQQQQQQPHQSQQPHQQQSIYPKLENVNDILQQQAHQASHALNTDPRPQLSPQTPGGGGGGVVGVIGDQHHQNKTVRLRKACDSCSIRKVKCDEAGPPCRACAALDIPCTFDRPSRRRGPPNRHAEALKKKRRLDGEGSGLSSPASPTNAAHALAQLSSHPPHLSAESICPLPTMNALIDDFFTYIHPLCPFPHEPSFREAWERREDYTNPSFLALLASMIATLVASFPRKPRLHLKSQTRDQYPSHLSLVDKCREVCASARGAGYLDRPSLNVYDACTSYFLGLVGAYTFQWRQLRLYFGESLTILRALGLHKASDQGHAFMGSLPALVGSNGPSMDGSRDFIHDNITEQIGRRVFWTVFVGARTMQQLGASFGELSILPSTPSEPLPPLPLEVDDKYIYPHDIMPQPEGAVPMLIAFNLNVRIYLSYSTLSASEMAFGMDELYDWPLQQRMIEQCLENCKRVIVGMPEILKVHPIDSQNGRFGQRRQPYYPPMPEYGTLRDPALSALNGHEPNDTQEARVKAQYEIQKANIYATHLSIRSYLVEKYFVLLDKANNTKTQNALQSSPGALIGGLDRLIGSSNTDAQKLEDNMLAERENVVKDLLVVLGSIDMVNMEPNGDSFTRKIRQIAGTLLEAPKERRGSVALQHQEYLYKFLDILSKLERLSPEGSDGGPGAVDEEAELRLWADLRDHQLKFQEQGGIYGFS